MRYVHPTPAHKKEAIEKLTNWEKRTPCPPTKSPQSIHMFW